MELQCDKNRIAAPLEIRGVLDLYHAQELRAVLAESLLSSAAVTLDLSGVEECGAAALQLLCSARRTAVEAGGSLRIQPGCPAVEQACAAYGIAFEEFLSPGVQHG